MDGKHNSLRSGDFAAVLFDLDGVLVDSQAAVEHTWDRWSRRHGIAPERTRATIHGRRTEEVVAALAPGLDAVAEAAGLEAEIVAFGDSRPIEGACRLYRALPAERRAVVTSATRSNAASRLAALGLEPPPAFVTAEDVRRGKPRPDCYLLAARLLDVSPDRCVAIEDAPAGIEAALAAGAHVVAVPTTHPAAELARAHAVVELASLLEHVRGALRLDTRPAGAPA